MRYEELAEVYKDLEKTTKILEKRQILSKFFKKAPADILPNIALLAQGRVFPAWSEEEIGIASKLMIKAIARTAGVQEKDVISKVKDTGDYGLAAEYFISHKRQRTLAGSPLTVKVVHEKLQSMPAITGSGSIDRKLNIVGELLSNAKPKEACYLVRTILGVLRIGVGEGVLRDSISIAFDIEPKIIESAYGVINDYGEVAKIAKKDGKKGLLKARLEPGRPVKVMLAQKVGSIEEGLERMGGTLCAEYKFDGARFQVHIWDNKIEVYTRRLDNVTKQFPDIVGMIKKGIKAKACIIEGEGVATDPKTKKSLPFQKLSRRIKRKYDIEETVKKIPVVLNLFDILYLNGKGLIDTPFKERRKKLEGIVKQSPNLKLAEQLITKDAKKAENFYKKALKDNQEGIMIKNLGAPYKPGSRVGYMVKLKPTMENLDLVLVGAEHGEGRRAKWFGTFLLACYDKENGKFLTIGKMGTGLTDKQFEEMTKTLKPLITSEKGKAVALKPKIVVEVAYEEIQKSPTYESGYALRFPRLIGVRTDKKPEDANDLNYVEQLYRTQK